MPLTTYRPRRDTKANWAAANPILKLGEVGLEFEKTIGVGQAKMKVGTGTTPWNSLDYSMDDDVTNKVINSFETISDENPVLSAGETLKRFASKVKTKFTYIENLCSNIQTLANSKISTSMIYTGTDSSNNGQVLAAPVGKQLKQLCDNNASAISTLNSNFSITGKLVVYYNVASKTMVIRLLTDAANDTGYELWLSTEAGGGIHFLSRAKGVVHNIW